MPHDGRRARSYGNVLIRPGNTLLPERRIQAGVGPGMLKILFIVALLVFGPGLLLLSCYGHPIVPAFGVTAYDPDRAYNGYTLFSTVDGDASGGAAGVVYLIDMRGNEVHRWNVSHTPGDYGYLLPDGDLLYAGEVKSGPAPAGGKGGVLQQIGWDGTVKREYRNDTLHHDFCRKPDGHNLAIAWAPMPDSYVDQVEGGLGMFAPGVMYSDSIVEIAPDGAIAWEWHAWEHLPPEQMRLHALADRNELTHTNAVEYLPAGNPYNGRESVLVCFRELDTVAIVDRETGNISWSWRDDSVRHPHDPTLLPDGHVLLFANCYLAPGAISVPPASAIVEIDPATGDIVDVYERSSGGDRFFSFLISGAQRLPNGNTLVCEGIGGRLFEVAPGGEIVWAYVNPHFSPGFMGNSVFRAYRYAPGDIDWPEALPSPDPGYGPRVEVSLKDRLFGTLARPVLADFNLIFSVREQVERLIRT
ncbi:MAG: Arylsulfotransferase (ASST) [Methanocella sp. PtaU1.Bin125]|nr:MAG: Arylsulfotransferase (ASST) [Methanocella sp. PtaU1.Bin125]